MTYLQSLERIKRNTEPKFWNVVAVVRCKDCLYWQDNNGGYPHKDCKWNENETPDATDYCSCGERRETAV